MKILAEIKGLVTEILGNYLYCLSRSADYCTLITKKLTAWLTLIFLNYFTVTAHYKNLNIVAENFQAINTVNMLKN